MASADPESNRPRTIKRQLSSGKLLLDDTGWLAPLNKMVWKSPNFMLYVMLAIGTAVYFLVKHVGFSTSSFLGAAVVELLLSMDNICLFHQIFEHFKVPVEVRPGLLFIGTPFMVLMRFLLFFSIKGIYNSIRPLMFAIGLFCCYQGGVVLWMTVTGMEEEEEDFDAESSTVVQWFKSLLGDKLVTKYQGSAFYLTMDGALRYTPMFLVLLAIEVTDVAFCIDGVSTIFMVDHFHVLTLFVGDVVAACVVRALYPQLAGTVELFPDLNYSVAVVLLLVGIDMCCGVFGLEFPPGWLVRSMGVLFALGMLSSVLRGVCRVAEQDQDTPDAVAEKNAEKNKAYGAA
jgi:predicted tellurium resistance membrane protein TerC